MVVGLYPQPKASVVGCWYSNIPVMRLTNISYRVSSLFTRSEQRAVVLLIALLLVLSVGSLFVRRPAFIFDGGEAEAVSRLDSLVTRYFAQLDSISGSPAQHASGRDQAFGGDRLAGKKFATDRGGEVEAKPGVKGEEKLEMNGADALDFERLPGIGTVLSERIIKYRNLLGGFVSVSQLLEVYGIGSEVFVQCAPELWVDTTVVVPLDVNLDSYGRFLRHPYLGRSEIDRLFRYRQEHGFIVSLQELKEYILGDSLYSIMHPYLRIGSLSEKEIQVEP